MFNKEPGVQLGKSLYMKKTHDFIYALSVFLVLPLAIFQGILVKSSFDILTFSIALIIYVVFYICHLKYRKYLVSAYCFSFITIFLLTYNYIIKGGLQGISVIWNLGLIFVLAVLFEKLFEIIYFSLLMIFFMVASELLLAYEIINPLVQINSDRLYIYRATSFLIASVFFVYIIFKYKRLESRYQQVISDNLEFNQVLLGVLYHDISNHLTTLLMKTERLSFEHRSISTKIIELKGVVDNVRKLEEYRYNKIAINVEVIDASQSMSNAIEHYAEQIAEKNIIIENKIPFNEVFTLADANVLETSVFGNILNNSIKFSPEGGSILISHVSNSDTIDILITDFGPGIPKHLHSNLFNYQTSRSGPEESQPRLGSGFGLPIAKSFVGLFDGDLSFTTNEKGTTFIVSLKKKVDHEESISN